MLFNPVIMKKLNLLILISGMALCSCSQTNQQKTKQMSTYFDEVMREIKHYDIKPMYNLQVNKNGCRLLVETNDMPPGSMGVFFGKGESMMLSLNDCIIKSGNQNIRLKVYPREGEEFISSYADIDVKLYYNSNKDSGFSNYVCLAKVTLPKNIVEMKLPYFELNIPFEAQVPYDFSSRLDSAVDLKTIPEIEHKILKKFEDKRALIVEGKMNDYMLDEKESYTMIGNMFYSTKADLLDDFNIGIDKFSKYLIDRKVMPIVDYEIVYYKNNKLAILRNKYNKENILKVVYKHKEKPATISTFFILYIPKGGSDFKLW